MYLEAKAGRFTVRGVSVAGVYTSLQVRELGLLLDCGIALKALAGVPFVCLTHGHADHIGALMSLLGMRGLMQLPPPRVFMPASMQEPLAAALEPLRQLQRFPLPMEVVAMQPGQETLLRGDLWIRAFRTHHTCPSLGYQLFRRVQKLKPEFRAMPGAELARLRSVGGDTAESLFDREDRNELAYATDTLIRVLDTHPSLLTTKTLILECSFLRENEDHDRARHGGHIHLDEILERASSFENESIVLMHFSQTLSPSEVHAIIARRCPPALRERVVVFAPGGQRWPGL